MELTSVEGLNLDRVIFHLCERTNGSGPSFGHQALVFMDCQKQDIIHNKYIIIIVVVVIIIIIIIIMIPTRNGL